jgi:hypothetical protein
LRVQTSAGDETTGINTAPRDLVSTRVLQRAETALFWGLLISIALVSLPLPDAHRWTPSLGAVAIGLSAFAYALCVIFAGSRIEVPMRRLWAPGVLIALPILWALVQTFPIAQSALAHPIWTSSNEVLHRDSAGRISVDPYANGTALMRLLLYVATFYLAVQLCRSSERAFVALAGIVVIGTAHALFRPLFELAGELSGAAAWDRAAGTVDPMFVGLSLLASIALAGKLVHRPAVTSPDWRVFGAELLRIAHSTAWAPAAALLILLAIAMETHSGRELLAICFGTVVLLLGLISASKAGRTGYQVMAALALAAALMAVWLVGQLIYGGQSSKPADANPAVAVQTPIQEALSAAPLLGHGYGTFEAAFPIYADAPLGDTGQSDPNGYLRLAFELGIPAAALLILAIAWTGVRCALGIYARRRDIVYPALGAAAAVTAGAYGLVSSGPGPAVATLLAFILGMGYSQSWASSDALRITRRETGGNGVRPADRQPAGTAGTG